MIPYIGVLIAAYIITRMLALIFTTPSPTGRIVLGVSAGTTIAIAVFVAGILLWRGAEVAELFSGPGR